VVARDALRLYFVVEEVGLDSLAEGFKLAVREIVDRAERERVLRAFDVNGTRPEGPQDDSSSPSAGGRGGAGNWKNAKLLTKNARHAGRTRTAFVVPGHGETEQESEKMAI